MNTTDRKFKCISSEEIKVTGWSEAFVVGEVYSESLELDIKNHLSLIDNPKKGPGQQWLVDKSQFELVNVSDLLESKTEI